MSELLPCPFCGGEAEMSINKESTIRAYFVGCMNCHIRLYKIDYKRFYTEAEAIAAWNSRAEQTCEWELEHSGTLYDKWRCSKCGYLFVEPRCDQGYTDLGPNYCPNCGCKVVG